MANLLVEIGNTALKAAWSDGMTLGKCFRYQGEKVLDFILSLTRREKPAVLVVASVSVFPEEDCARLQRIPHDEPRHGAHQHRRRQPGEIVRYARP